MRFEEAKGFMQRHHRGVVTTYQPDGAMHASIVLCGVYRDHAAFVIVRGTSVKARNLRRDPRCTVLAVSADWLSWVAVEGEAQLFDYDNTDAETVRLMLRDVYRACGDKEHPDWEEYDRVMRQQRAVVVLVRPQRVYGLLRAGSA
ncbi:MAG: PPOX class F420-dependent enzyme [Candidatus Tectimicrobiota bacterium]|nr:MAG: PPOX class F420-dependent enzyme [Candidatus Tectomicrobia bacterium]